MAKGLMTLFTIEVSVAGQCSKLLSRLWYCIDCIQSMTLQTVFLSNTDAHRDDCALPTYDEIPRFKPLTMYQPIPQKYGGAYWVLLCEWSHLTISLLTKKISPSYGSVHEAYKLVFCCISWLLPTVQLAVESSLFSGRKQSSTIGKSV